MMVNFLPSSTTVFGIRWTHYGTNTIWKTYGRQGKQPGKFGKIERLTGKQALRVYPFINDRRKITYN
jgi:hypothetical protein